MAIQEELIERLEILQSADMIEETVVTFCKRVIDILYEEKDSYPTEGLEIFITHLAIATQRVLHHEAEADIDDAIINSLKLEKVYKIAQRILNRILLESECEFPTSEKNLLLIHLCNICKSE